MKQKTIFFDIDGTLLGTRGGLRFQIPPSTLEAIRLLKRNGHRVAVCSGRQDAFIHRYFPGIFNSFVAMNGTRVVYEGKTIYNRSFSEKELREITAHFDSYGCRYILVGRQYGWMRNVPPSLTQELSRAYGLPGFLVPARDLREVEANVLDFVFPKEEDYRLLAPAFTEGMRLNRHGGGLTADLSFAQADKAIGIAKFLACANIPKEDTIAFGDGGNDLSMMSAVGLGVAMGNSVDEVKKAAAYVTSDIFDDGIYHALKYLGLI